jgi:hypothetical protein
LEEGAIVAEVVFVFVPESDEKIMDVRGLWWLLEVLSAVGRRRYFSG